MNEIVRQKLIEVARNKRKNTITYQELSDACNLNYNMRDNPDDRMKIGKVIGEISTQEFSKGRPLLSSLVITKIGGYQGDGFYTLCESLGLGSAIRLKKRITFDVEKMNDCYDFWQNDDNYNKYK